LARRVMVVDDSFFARKILKDILNKNGYEVIGEAENGQVAISKYSELNPDLVTMDMTMPEVDGMAALKSILAIDQDARIIMISAMGQRTIVSEALVAGAKCFVVKPYNSETVINAVERALSGALKR